MQRRSVDVASLHALSWGWGEEEEKGDSRVIVNSLRVKRWNKISRVNTRHLEYHYHSEVTINVDNTSENMKVWEP